MIKSSTWKLSRSFLVTHAVLAIAFFAFLPAVLGLVNLLSGNLGTSTPPTNASQQQGDVDQQPAQQQPGTDDNTAQPNAPDAQQPVEEQSEPGTDNPVQPDNALPDQSGTAQPGEVLPAEPERNLTAEFIAGLITAALYLFIMAAAAQGSGFADKERILYNGFIAGAIASIPGLVLTVMLTLSGGDVLWIKVMHRIWMSPYIEIYSVHEDIMIALAYVTLPLMPIATGVGYLRGIKKKDEVVAKLKATAPKPDKI
ncbi:hypothetical protein [Mahella australiensis]|uniref:Uncharacterized protein n=1 Tax=Mahella australiensis (strain DSM 15567 / CIP 107919 / 50-1 BON) TaxID=697281 RepID=F3ZVH9_MAHA5|nr:hypothetical protein [Mahella australiensis]AEE96341.1 hypothetical protein Mahau_1144 [Mahella australiensis 50-1 BON]